MTKDGGQRIAISSGAMLADLDRLGNVAGLVGVTGTTESDKLFDPAFWARRGELSDVTQGRGSAWFIGSAPNQWVLRHYRRGGFIARLMKDRYVWVGEERVRAFAEWRLLHVMVQRGLPGPTPIAARYRRSGFYYRCDLITRRIVGAEPLSRRLAAGPLDETLWRAIGATVARFHAAGVDHADLNAHNILVDAAGNVSVIDFDRGRLRHARSWASSGRASSARVSSARASSGLASSGWAAGNLSRLRRSLFKVSRELPADRFTHSAWQSLAAGYGARGDRA